MDDLTRKGDSSRCSLNEIARAADRNGAFGKGVFCGWFAPLSTYRWLERGGLGEIERDLDGGIIKTASWKAPFIIQDSEDAG